jgi:hypothetical protein
MPLPLIERVGKTAATMEMIDNRPTIFSKREKAM